MKILRIILFTIIFLFAYIANSFANINLIVSPIKYEIDTSTGSVITKTATLYNKSDQIHTIYTGKSDFEATGNTGNPRFVRKSELVYEDQHLSTWINIDTESFQINPGEKKEVEFTITVPDNATPGGHYGAVFFKNNNSEQSAGAKISINVDYGVLLLVNVDGEIVVDGDLEETKISNGGGSGWGGGESKNDRVKKDECPIFDLTSSNYDGKCVDNIINEIFEKDEELEETISKIDINNLSEKEIEDFDDLKDQDNEYEEFVINFDTLFSNDGNVHLKPTGKIELVDENGNELKGIGKEIIRNDEGAIIGEKIVDYLPINDNGGNVLPNTKRNFQVEWKGFPYEAYDEEGKKIIKYWNPEEYYTRKNGIVTPIDKLEENLYPWERINERINYEKICAKVDLSYTDRNGEDVEFNSAEDFYVQYKEKYIGLNPYFFIIGGFILFFLFFFWFILCKSRRKKCIECGETIKKDMKICPYCGTRQEDGKHININKTIEKKPSKKKTSIKKKKTIKKKS